MQYSPKPHQQIAADFLQQRNNAALFLDMGLGKTVVTLTHLQNLLSGLYISKALVIAPKRVAEDTWSRESAKWDHLQGLRISKVLGDRKHRLAALASDADIYVINRENVEWLVQETGKAWPFDCIVIDELSSFKSASSKRWRSLKRVIKLCSYVIGLTGTPAPNGYLDLWPQVFLLDQGERLGKTITAYRQTYFYPGAHSGHIVYEWHLKSHAKDEIDTKLSDLCLSMSKDDWLTLPPLLYNDVVVQMNKSERAIYTQFTKDQVLPLLQGKLTTLEHMESAVVGETAATVSGKLLQMANGAVYDDKGDVVDIHDRKLDALRDIVDEANGQPVLVYYSYKHDLARLRKAIPEGRQLFGTDMISAWNRGEIPVMFVHPASAGHGLNLQEGGHIIVWFGLPWSLELYQQANARLYRQGQEQSVIIHHIICAGTIDEKVLAALQTKDATQRSLLDALKNYVKEVTPS